MIFRPKIFILSLTLMAFTQLHASSTINCSTPKTAKKYRTLCKTVIDPLKFKKGEVSTINCTAELGDGYEIGICEKVNINEQHRLKNKRN